MCGDKSRPSNEEDHQPRESSHHLHQIHHAAAAGDKERSETEEDADSDLGCTVRIGEDTSSYAAAASPPLGTASPPSIVAGFASAVAAEEESVAATVAALFRLMTNLDRCLSSASLKNPIRSGVLTHHLCWNSTIYSASSFKKLRN